MPIPVQVKQEPQEPVSIIPTSKSSIKFHECVVGGRNVKFMVDQNSPINVMSLTLFKKLQKENFLFFTTDMVPTNLGEFILVGQHVSKLAFNNKSEYINFSVREGTENFVMISKNMANKLGIL